MCKRLHLRALTRSELATLRAKIRDLSLAARVPIQGSYILFTEQDLIKPPVSFSDRLNQGRRDRLVRQLRYARPGIGE